MQFSKRKWILIPVEVKVRAFRSRLLLSCFAAEAGFGVIFGSSRLIHKQLTTFPKGLIFDKSISSNKEEHLREQHEQGYVLACIDEEGLVYFDDRTYATTRLSRETLSLTTCVCAWGDVQARVMRDYYPGYADRIVVTGNPRVDLWRPELRLLYAPSVEAIRSAHGPYILVPSNFGTYIHANGPNFIINQAKGMGHISSPEDEALLLERLNHIGEIFRHFLVMLRRLSREYPDRKIVLRPHPADDHKEWTAITDTLPNVDVIWDGDVTPWILGSDVVIHNSCTTGVEAYLLGKPAISYMPVTNERVDMYLPNALSERVQDLDALVDAIAVVSRRDSAEAANARIIANRHIAAEDGRLASQRIVDEFLRIDLPESDFVYRPIQENRIRTAYIRSKARVKQSLHRLGLLRLLPVGAKRATVTKTYMRQKYPGDSLEEVRETVASFREVLNRFSDVHVCELSSGVYCVYAGSRSK